jgi:hypothetical protein
MSAFRRYNESRGALFDLGHLGGLSADRTLPLFVSPRTLYILQNLAAADVEQSWRYAVELQDGGYLAVRPDDDEHALFAQVSKEVALELMPELNMAGTLLNYQESLIVQTSTDNADAGSNTLTIQGPGTDQAWVIDHVSLQDHNHTITDTILYVTNGTVNVILQQGGALVTDAWRHFTDPIHLSHDLALKCLFVGCTAGDDLYLVISGYIMSLVE